MAVRLIDAGVVSSIRSQTLYHGLGYSFSDDTPNTIVFAIPENPYMCIGFFQDAAQELDITYCNRTNLPIIRRETGGGAVYIDKNQLFVQWIFKPTDLPARVEDRFKLFVQPIIETYRHFGVEAYYYPINDVHVDGKKIVGTGAGGIGDAEVVTGNFLIDFDYQVMSEALQMPHQRFRKDFSRYLREFVTTMSRELDGEVEIDLLKEIYLEKCEGVLGESIVKGKLTQSEVSQMERLDRKMMTSEWLYQTRKQGTQDRMVKVHAGVWLGEVNRERKEFPDKVKVGVKLLDKRIEELTFEINCKEVETEELDRLKMLVIGTELMKTEELLTGFFGDERDEICGIGEAEWKEIFLKMKELRMGIS